MRTGGSPAASSAAQRAVRARAVAARQAVRQLLDRGRAADDRRRPRRAPRRWRRPGRHRATPSRPPRPGPPRSRRAPVDEQRGGRGPDLVSTLAREPHDPVLQRARIGDAREGEGAAVALERRQQLAPGVEAARHEHQAGRRPQPACRRQHERLVARRQRVGPPDDQRLRAAEEQRRGEVVERRGERRGIRRPPTASAPVGRSPTRRRSSASARSTRNVSSPWSR